MGWLRANDLWRLASPPQWLFGDQQDGLRAIEPGDLSAITKAGPGGGVVEVEGIARDAWSITLRCASGGEVNVSETANPGALPTFQISTDGVTYRRAIRVSDNRDEAYIDDGVTGLRWRFRNGASPSFVANTTYSLTSQVSPTIAEFLPIVESEIEEAAAGSYDAPLISVPPHWRYHGACLLRWKLVTKEGVSKKRDIQALYPKDTYEWMEKVNDGRRAVKPERQGLAETPPGTSFPLLAPNVPDPLVPPI